MNEGYANHVHTHSVMSRSEAILRASVSLPDFARVICPVGHSAAAMSMSGEYCPHVGQLISGRVASWAN